MKLGHSEIAGINTLAVPRSAIAIALIISASSFLIVMIVALQHTFVGANSFTVTGLICFIFSLAISSIWPIAGWRWGIYLSSVFLLYFLVVFVALLMNSQFELTPILLAANVLAWGCAGGVAGRAIRGKAVPESQ
jgi:hypothetical protein